MNDSLLKIGDFIRANAELMNYTVVEATAVLATHLTEVIKSHAYELLTRQDVKNLLDNLKLRAAAVVEEVIPTLIKPGELQMYVCYGGKDEFNLAAQIESFLHVAKERGIEVGVGYDREGHHDMETADRLLPGLIEWLRPRIAPYAPYPVCRK